MGEGVGNLARSDESNDGQEYPMTQVVDAPFARQFLQRLHGAANTHDADGVASLCSDNVVWEDPAAPQTLHR